MVRARGEPPHVLPQACRIRHIAELLLPLDFRGRGGLRIAAKRRRGISRLEGDCEEQEYRSDRAHNQYYAPFAAREKSGRKNGIVIAVLPVVAHTAKIVAQRAAVPRIE